MYCLIDSTTQIEAFELLFDYQYLEHRLNHSHQTMAHLPNQSLHQMYYPVK